MAAASPEVTERMCYTYLNLKMQVSWEFFLVNKQFRPSFPVSCFLDLPTALTDWCFLKAGKTMLLTLIMYLNFLPEEMTAEGGYETQNEIGDFRRYS